MTTASICIMGTIIAYLLVMLAVGWVCSKKNNNTDDFYLGGRELGPLTTAMSAEASDMSGWLLMGLPGVAYLTGIADAGWTALGLALGTYVNWLIVAKRIRCYTQITDSITLPDFFSKRFGDKKNLLCGIAAVVILIFFIPYTASGFAACGKLFSTIFGVDYVTAMIVSAIIIVAYCALGGFLAASTTDLIQSIVMTFALILVLVFGVNMAGGLDVVMDNAKGLEGYLSMFAKHNVETGGSDPYGAITIVSTFAWGLGYFGMPHVLLRFMAIKDASKLKTSRRIASIWVLISMFVAISIGVIGYSVTQAGHIGTLDGSNSETIIIVLADLLSKNGPLLAIMGGLVLAGILASTMSTADSQLLAASSSFSQNLLQDFLHIKLDQKKTLFIARCTVCVIAALGVVLALDPNSSVFEIVSFAWAGFGASFGPVVIVALFWKRGTKNGALAGMIVGAIVVFAWKFGISKLGGAFAIYELLPAFLCGLIAIVVVSLLDKAPEKSIGDTFDEVKKMVKSF